MILNTLKFYIAQSSNCRLKTEDCRLKNAKYNEINHYQAINFKIPTQ